MSSVFRGDVREFSGHYKEVVSRFEGGPYLSVRQPVPTRK